MPTTEQKTTSPAQRIRAAFANAQAEHRGVLIPYFMCGYPTISQSATAVLAAARAGADIIELGLPFSDPLADGPVIQLAGQVALANGMTMRGCLDIACEVSTQTAVPLVLMGYYNPLLSYGLARFCQDAAAAGACGLIVPDLPPDEAEPLQRAAEANGLTIIYLIPPTTPSERIKHITTLAAQIPGSFIYCVSLSGVTGVRGQLPEHLPLFLTRVLSYTSKHNLPIVVGFGISTPMHVSSVVALADGVVVGSALVKLLAETPADQQAEAVGTYIGELRAATGK